MAADSIRVAGLDSWLGHISAVHPREIELGLDRIRAVADRMNLQRPARWVISIAGTNGKGSCVAALEACLLSAGYRVGSYTSPHLHRFNERIKLNGMAIADDHLCDAFSLIESCRESVSLSYFEFATLAALWIFQQNNLDVALLEVGLGGRLDAVNLVDADVAVITSISLDHEDWLGEGREAIGGEKAGIFRAGVPVVCGDNDPPESVLTRARELAAPFYGLGKTYRHQLSSAGKRWHWQGLDSSGKEIRWQQLVLNSLALDNLATSLQVLALLPVTITEQQLNEALSGLALAGRFERRNDEQSGRQLLLDVAHNPAAAQLLATRLQQLRRFDPSIERVAVVMAVMADKDIEAIAASLQSCVDIWYIAQVDQPRCMPADEAAHRLQNQLMNVPVQQFQSVRDAYQAACDNTGPGDLIVVTGSFFTVAVAREFSVAVSSEGAAAD